jgi:phosphopantetheinyl transferase
LLISASADAFTTVWRLWSMKESAYKVYIQMGGERFFNPAMLECSLESLKNGQVKMNHTSFYTSTTINAQYIFSSATLNKSVPNTCVFQLANKNRKEQSNFIHKQVLKDVAVSHALNLAELQLHKSKTGVPSLYYQNKPLKTSLSISHHGNYAAYSVI